jgi:hypothetical protein
MSGSISISADDALQLAMSLVSEPLDTQVFDLRDDLTFLANEFAINWLRRRAFATGAVRKDLRDILGWAKQLADILVPPPPQLDDNKAPRRDEMRARILRNSLAIQMRTIERHGLLSIETVTEGPSLMYEVAPLMLCLHEAARRALCDLAKKGSTTETASTGQTVFVSRRRHPEYDDLIAGIAELFQKFTGGAPRFSDHSAQLEQPRKLVGRFVEFALKVLPAVARAFSELKLELDDEPELRRLANPTPDEIREAYRYVTARGGKDSSSHASNR